MRRHWISMSALLVAFSACGVPSGSSSRPIDPDAVPSALNATTTTLDPSLVPTTTTIATDQSSEPSTTVPVEPVALFYVAGNQVVAIPRLLLSPAAPPQVLAALAEGLPTGDEAAGLRNAIPRGLMASVSVERGIATVDLPPTFSVDVQGSDQRLAIAQIVLTLTRRAGIGQVIFTSDRAPLAVPRGRGDLTAPGGLVACDDYDNLLPVGYSC
jgi:hypothetical protein